MRKIFLCNAFLLLLFCGASAQQNTGAGERVQWLQLMDKIARPVIYNLANDELKENMPEDISPVSDNPKERVSDQYLEALGRTLSGIAPWLQSDSGSTAEIQLREQYRTWTIKAIANATDAAGKDFMNWDRGGQPLVDAAFFALGLIRCPWLWNHLDSATKNNVVHCLQRTRKIVPGYNNWILFSGMIEAFFCKYGYDYEPMRIEYGVREFMQHWYVGDGMFSDGMNFHLDYYNSYVIQPFLKEMIDIVNEKTGRYTKEKQRLAMINNRYSQIQERSVNADGSFPAYGRSIVYRSGAFHHLANMALYQQLPSNLSAAQVREALDAVMNKTLKAQGTFDKNDWLVIGLAGKQPKQANSYITQGSLYLCTEIFLPLGLSPGSAFWSEPSKPWTEKAIWNGENYEDDHALD